MIQDIPEFVLGSPVLVAILTIIMVLGVHYSKRLDYQEFMLIHTLKRVSFPVMDSFARKRGRPLVRVKRDSRSQEYVTTVPESPAEFGRKLLRNGFSPHLIATLKAREAKSIRQYAHSQYAWFDGDKQLEVYLFPSPNGGTEVYAHTETAITDPEGHLEDKQYPGDTTGKLQEVLE